MEPLLPLLNIMNIQLRDENYRDKGIDLFGLTISAKVQDFVL